MSGCDQPGLVPVEEALAEMLRSVATQPETEVVYLEKAVGRVLAESPLAKVDVPPADNSSMDGYAVACSSLNAEEPTSFVISQRIPAGHAPDPLLSGTVARIFTGAEIPEGADAVVMQEDVVLEGGRVVVPHGVFSGQNIRPRGQDIRAGQAVLEQGRRLQPADVGVLASVGLDSVLVYRPLTVAVMSTGDELVEPGKALGPGQIYNSNRFVLSALLQQLGFSVVDIGRVADNPEDTREALEKAAQRADCIISTGGVSVGEEDHVKSSVEALGSLSMWRLKIKPGKPLAFGEVASTPFFGLPGNPASTLITFCILARPFLLTLQGSTVTSPLMFQVPAGFKRSHSGGRQEYLRARIEHGQVVPFSNQSSGVLSSASWAHGLAVVPADTQVQLGDLVGFLPFSELLG